MIEGYYTGNQLIDESLAGVRDFSRKYYNEAAMYFMRGYRDFRIFNDSGSIKDAWCTVTAINTVNYPKDAIRIISVGIIADGEFFTFTRSDDLVSPLTSPIDESLDSDRGEDDTLRRTPTVGYGAKGTNVEYYFKDEQQKRRIVLSRIAVDVSRFAARSEVLIKYVSDGVDNLDELYIPNDAANMLIAYIEYKLVESRPDVYSRAYAMDKKESYYEARNMYDALQMPTLQELIDVVYETSSQNVRRL